MPNPHFQLQTARTYPTASSADTLFFELVESGRTNPATAAAPEYGTVHPDTGKYPNHKLCFIQDADNKAGFQQWWYCADRDSQESYNADITYPYGGNVNYPRITRTYILPRAEGDIPLELGTEDPGGALTGGSYFRPGGTSIYLRPDASSTYIRSSIGPATLVFQSKKEIGGQIGSLYVQVTRVFDVIPGSEEVIEARGTGQIDNGYVIERPLGDYTFLKLTWTLTLPREIANNNLSNNYAPCPISRYSLLILTDERITALDDTNQLAKVVRVYEGNDQDDASVSFPSQAYTHYEGIVFPGDLPPEKFIVSMRAVEETYEINDPANQGLLAAYPRTLSPTQAQALAGGEEDGLGKVEILPDSALRGKKRVKYYTDLVLRTLTGKEWNDAIGNYIPYTVKVMTVEAADGLEAAAAGTERTLTPINTMWTQVTTESPVETTLGGDEAYSSARTYQTMHPMEWPPVLMPITANVHIGFVKVRPAPGEDATNDSGSELFWQPEYSKEAWAGLCVATVDVAWMRTAPAMSAIETMQPTGLLLNWPGVIHLSIPAALHGEYPFTGTTGSDHPKYGPVTYSKTWAATNYTDWPASIVKEMQVRPFKGGYLVRRITVQKPY